MDENFSSFLHKKVAKTAKNLSSLATGGDEGENMWKINWKLVFFAWLTLSIHSNISPPFYHPPFRQEQENFGFFCSVAEPDPYGSGTFVLIRIRNY